jgi:hypothetical protein
MPVLETYSRRKRRAEQGEPDVYQYDRVPDQLRVQVLHILDAAIPEDRQWWDSVHSQLLMEKGLFYLQSPGNSPRNDILRAIAMGFPDVEDWLDVVDLCFCSIYRYKDLRPVGFGDPEKAIEELNIRLRQAGFGYQFEAGQIVRVDSQLLHSEVVKPALRLLADPRFEGAQNEFVSAHSHYRAGEHEDAILDANRAFESTMKTICDIRNWDYQKARGAGDLIGIICDNGLLPRYLIATLQSGLLRVRNEAGGHGQGATPRETPGHVAGYALHLAAANIVLLVEALNETERK